MKNLLLGFLIAMMSGVASANDLEVYHKQVCEEVGGKYLILESFPVQEKCSINEEIISFESFYDKYNHFVRGMMIDYISEYKYSDASKWKSYLDFFAQDIQDLKVFSQAKLTDEQKKSVSQSLSVQENLYNFMYLQETLGEKVTVKIEKILEQYEAKIPENKKQALYQRTAKKLDEKVKEMEYFQMVAHFTPEGYQAFLFKMNVYKYMLLLVQGRME